MTDVVIKPWRMKGICATHVPTSAQVFVDTEDCVDRNRGLALEMLDKKVREIEAKKRMGLVQLWRDHDTDLLTESTTGRGEWYQPVQASADKTESVEAMPESLIGLAVSVDVSTGDDDAAHRYFGKVDAVQECVGEKGGIILLVQEPTPNFAAAMPGKVADAFLVNPCPLSGKEVYLEKSNAQAAAQTARANDFPAVVTPLYAAYPAPQQAPAVQGKDGDLSRSEWMLQWDKWRSYIAGGGKGSWPREDFESLLDELDAARNSNPSPAVSPSDAPELGDFEIDEIAEKVIKPVAGERISFGQARKFARAVIKAHLKKTKS